MHGPAAIAETTTLDSTEWEFEKCSASTDYPLWFKSPDETYVNNTYTNGFASITHTVVSAKYIVNFGDYGGSSFFSIGVNLTASVTEGFLETVRVVFSEDYDVSEVCLFGAYPRLYPYFYKWENLTIEDWAYCFYGKSRLEGSEKAFITAVGRDRPKEVLFSARAVHWILRAPENVSQQLEITAEVTYFNGTGHVKIVLPTLISLIADVGDTFEDARKITAGSYIASISSFHDPVDCYRIWLAKDLKIGITAVLRDSSVNLTLYDVNGEPKTSVTSGRNYSRDPVPMDEITYTTDMEGYWYIKVQSIFDQGIYKLTVETEP